MSRSYRKNLILTDSSTNHRYKPTRKQVASRITRAKLKQHPEQTKQFRKIYNTYAIVDFKYHYTKDDSMPFYKWRNK